MWLFFIKTVPSIEGCGLWQTSGHVSLCDIYLNHSFDDMAVHILKCHGKTLRQQAWEQWCEPNLRSKCHTNIFQMCRELSGIPGPDLHLDLCFVSYADQILMQGKNPGIAWKYALPKAMNGTQQPAAKRHVHVHAWSTVRSECSASCGGGEFISLCRPPSLFLKQVLSPQASFNCVVWMSNKWTVSYGNHHSEKQILLYYLRIFLCSKEAILTKLKSATTRTQSHTTEPSGGNIQGAAGVRPAWVWLVG